MSRLLDDARRANGNDISTTIWDRIRSSDEHDIILVGATAAFAIVFVNAIPPPYSIRNLLKCLVSAAGISITSYFAVERGLGTMLFAYGLCVLFLVVLMCLLEWWRGSVSSEGHSPPPGVEREDRTTPHVDLSRRDVAETDSQPARWKEQQQPTKSASR